VLNGGSDIDTFLINGLVSNDLNGNGGRMCSASWAALPRPS